MTRISEPGFIANPSRTYKVGHRSRKLVENDALGSISRVDEKVYSEFMDESLA